MELGNPVSVVLSLKFQTIRHFQCSHSRNSRAILNRTMKRTPLDIFSGKHMEVMHVVSYEVDPQWQCRWHSPELHTDASPDLLNLVQWHPAAATDLDIPVSFTLCCYQALHFWIQNLEGQCTGQLALDVVENLTHNFLSNRVVAPGRSFQLHLPSQ